MQTWWKNPRIVGNALYWSVSCLMRTLRVKVHNEVDIEPGRAYIVAFWHGKHFLPVIMLKDMHDTPCCTLVSPSRDGTMLAVYLAKHGYDILHGSSRKANVQALFRLKEKIEQGYSVGTGIDGPLGPRHQVKPGFVYLSQVCQAPIVPVGAAYDKCWQFNKSWDRFELPKPFAKAALVLGKPFVVGENDDLEDACAELTRRLHAADNKAEQLLTV